MTTVSKQLDELEELRPKGLDHTFVRDRYET